MIERKYYLKRQIWKREQIKKSLKSLLELTRQDERIEKYFEMIHRIEIDIEDCYTKIEAVCIEIERGR